MADTAMRRLFSPEFQDNSRELMQERRAAFLRTDANVFRAACEALAELDLRTKLKSVAIPVLVLVGEKDEATPPPMSEELATSLPKARLMVLSGCAHVPQLQAPRQFLDALIPFLTQTEIH